MKASIMSAALSVSLVFPGAAIPASQATAAAEDTSNLIMPAPKNLEARKEKEEKRAAGQQAQEEKAAEGKEKQEKLEKLPRQTGSNPSPGRS